jgi:hypothetical protein
MRREGMTHCNVPFLTSLVLVCAFVGIGILTPAVAQSPRQPSVLIRPQLVGSWLVTYDVQAFGVPIPILLTFGRGGVMIESDSPAPTPVGSLGIVILSNGHGAWESKGGSEFAYLYRKLIYQQDGFTPFGTTRTSATGIPSADGTQLQATLSIEFLDTNGEVVFSTTGSATGTRIHAAQQ